MRRAMLEALEKKYEAEIAAADATIHVYLNNSVGIGEHPQHLDEIDKQLSKIVEAEEKQNALQAFKL
jgi:CO dehydrogenase nickel-insertion accessory protein CooC1